MFTCKLIDEIDNSETLFETTYVRCGKDISDSNMPRKIWVDTPEGEKAFDVRETRDAGKRQTMFVMNRFGATVAKYQL